MIDFLPILISLLVLVLAVAVFRKGFWQRYVVQDIYWALDYRDGSFVKLLDPGTYWKFGNSKITHVGEMELGFLAGVRTTAQQEIILIDKRAAIEHVAGQEVLTKDNLGLKVSLSAQFKVADPVAAFQKTDSFRLLLHDQVQLALRAAVSALTLDELLDSREAVSTTVHDAVRSKMTDYGLDVEHVAVRDIMLSKELRSSYAAVVTARKEGEAVLERARGETAAMRSLANAAQAVKNNPELLQLRILQAMSEGEGGNTIVVGMPPHAALGLHDSKQS